MPSARHGLILLCILAASLGLSVPVVRMRSASEARWPQADSLFRVDDWMVDPEQVEPNGAGVLLRRSYRDAVGHSAELVVWSVPQPHAKQLFRKGPDRDFLGAGYTTEAMPDGLVPPIPGGGALIARQGPRAWLLVYMYGERRGPLGDGPDAWILSELDGLFDRPNNYFLARLGIPFDGSPPAQDAARLSGVLFQRLTDWYSQSV